MKAFSSAIYILFTGICCLMIESCRMQKDTSVNRGMQNLTARYNILYNARLLLEESRENIENSWYDDYGQVLSVYKEPAENSAKAETAILDSVINKANTIVGEKANSNYVDDAWYLIAKANYLKAEFFNAAEFFTYVFKTYPHEQELRLSSLAWKARALMQLNNPEEAGSTIDTALKYIDASKKPAEVYAAYAQLLIRTGKEHDAIEILNKAIGSKGAERYKIRWIYILAQLQERNKQYTEAYTNYRKVVKSNASFEMAFNANLNRIRMEDEQSGNNIDRISSLRSLLRSDKNKDFIDQIYYRIGDIYLERNQPTQAIGSYQTAARKSTNNQTQKGLAYLKLAEIYFANGDYTKAKAYYDTTLATLPPSYQDFDLIKRKAVNLELLASRFRIIAREDTLQTLARMTRAEREERIGELVREQARKMIAQPANDQNTGTFVAAIDKPGNTQTEGKFYFNNIAAISQGLSDFKRRWGTRPPEDNWRRSNKTAAEITEAANDRTGPVNIVSVGNDSTVIRNQLYQAYTDNLPVSPEKLKLSNERIAGAYYDIADFYKDELKDNQEAIHTFEELLKRVPGSSYEPAVYYNLYLLYSGTDPSRSNEYRNILLKNYPNSTYAKVILNPVYGRESDEKEAALNQAYNEIYDLYTQRNYPDVIKQVSTVENQFGQNSLSPQFAYLNALAVGHTQKLLQFENLLKSIVDTFAADQLVTPLVKQHLQYISAHRQDFESRPTALLDYSPDENIFAEPERAVSPVVKTQPLKTPAPAKGNEIPAPVAKTPAAGDTVVRADSAKEPVAATIPSVKTEAAPALPASKPSFPFSLPDSAEYYFVVNVSSPGLNLSPSRFGIGQFNRSRYTGLTIKHQLKVVNNENQLIFVGPFYSHAAVTDYERNILPLMRDIMKIPAERYNTFVISKEELDKLNTRTMIDLYLEFYKNNR